MPWLPIAKSVDPAPRVSAAECAVGAAEGRVVGDHAPLLYARATNVLGVAPPSSAEGSSVKSNRVVPETTRAPGERLTVWPQRRPLASPEVAICEWSEAELD